MKKLKKIIAEVLLTSVLLQPLGLVTPVLAEEVRMEYSDSDHIHAPKVVNGVTYEYDANGNLVNDGERRIDWNQDNLPTKITKGDQVVEFFYDANGQRVAKEVKDTTTGATTSKTIYPNQYLEITQLPNNAITQNYYFANGRRIALSSLAPSVQQPTLTFLHQDHLGSTVLATDSNSQPTSETLSYFPYGSSVNNLAMEQFNNSSYLFTGQELDSESNLYNYNARLYNPKTGAFISADSIGGGNRYAYAANNPMVFVDPSGNQHRHRFHRYIPSPALGQGVIYDPSDERFQAFVNEQRASLGENISTEELLENTASSLSPLHWGNLGQGQLQYVVGELKRSQIAGWQSGTQGGLTRAGISAALFGWLTNTTIVLPLLPIPQIGYNLGSIIEEGGVCFDLAALELALLGELDPSLKLEMIGGRTEAEGKNPLQKLLLVPHALVRATTPEGEVFYVDPSAGMVFSSLEEYSSLWEGFEITDIWEYSPEPLGSEWTGNFWEDLWKLLPVPVDPNTVFPGVPEDKIQL